MDEQSWQAEIDPEVLLIYLGNRLSDQQRREYCLRCCREVWRTMPQQARTAIEAAEQFLHGETTANQLSEYNDRLGQFCDEEVDSLDDQSAHAAFAAYHASFRDCSLETASDCFRNLESAGISCEKLCTFLRKEVVFPLP